MKGVIKKKWVFWVSKNIKGLDMGMIIILILNLWIMDDELKRQRNLDDMKFRRELDEIETERENMRLERQMML